MADLNLAASGVPGTGASGAVTSTRLVGLSGWFGQRINYALIGNAGAGGIGSVIYVPAGTYDYTWLLTTNAIRIGPNWAKAGVWYGGVKGIPNFPVDITVNTLGTNAATNTTLIQNAINACADYHAVYLSQSGTFPVNALTLKSRCVLRGAGMGLTILTRSGNFGTMASPQPGTYYDVTTNITSGYTAGSTSLVVASSSGFAVGGLALIDQLNSRDYASTGDCSYCGRMNDGSLDPSGWPTGGDTAARDQRETVMITGINGNTLTLDKPLNWTWTADRVPQLTRCSVNLPTIYSGVEDLTVNCLTDDAAMWRDNILFQWAAYCWVKNCEVINAGRHNVAFEYNCYGCEERECYTHDSHAWAGDQGYGTWMYYGATNCLIENNEYFFLHCHVDIEAGGAGNVVAYNYGDHTRVEGQTTWFTPGFGEHGTHCYLNLFEGNVTGGIMFDYTHGSGSHSMIFRNHLHRQNTGESDTDNIQCVMLYEWQYYHSAIGNIMGYSGCTGVYELTTSSSFSNPCIFRLSATDSKTTSTLIREGNYDFIGNALRWSAGAKDIPDSLYLAAKPSWWDSSPWPPFTPERGGFNPANLNKIPAQTRWEAR